MKVYKIEVMVIDFDNLGGEGIKDVLENTKYPNYCIGPDVMEIKSVDIGEWEDENPLNNIETRANEFRRLFQDYAEPNTGSGVVSNGIAMEDHPGMPPKIILHWPKLDLKQESNEEGSNP